MLLRRSQETSMEGDVDMNQSKKNIDEESNTTFLSTHPKELDLTDSTSLI